MRLPVLKRLYSSIFHSSLLAQFDEVYFQVHTAASLKQEIIEIYGGLSWKIWCLRWRLRRQNCRVIRVRAYPSICLVLCTDQPTVRSDHQKKVSNVVMRNAGPVPQETPSITKLSTLPEPTLTHEQCSDDLPCI